MGGDGGLFRLRGVEKGGEESLRSRRGGGTRREIFKNCGVVNTGHIDLFS